MFVRWRPVERADHWEKIWRFWSPDEAYHSWWCMHTIILYEWRMDQEVERNALSYSLAASFMDLLSHCSWARMRQTIMEAHVAYL